MSELEVIDAETGELVATKPRVVVQLSNEQLQYISRTEFVPKGLRGNIPAIMACVATGRAIGIDDMTSLRSINVIDGKPSFSAELMVLLVRRNKHSITGDVTGEKAIARGRRQDNGDEMTVEWTLEMAKRANLLGKDNWKKYPESMLWARAVSQLCRMLFADVFVGSTYSSEEMSDEFPQPASEQSELVDKQTDDRKVTPEQHKKLHALIADLEKRQPNTDWEALSKDLAFSMFGKKSRADLTVTEMSDLIEALPTADVKF